MYYYDENNPNNGLPQDYVEGVWDGGGSAPTTTTGGGTLPYPTADVTAPTPTVPVVNGEKVFTGIIPVSSANYLQKNKISDSVIGKFISLDGGKSFAYPGVGPALTGTFTNNNNIPAYKYVGIKYYGASRDTLVLVGNKLI